MSFSTHLAPNDTLTTSQKIGLLLLHRKAKACDSLLTQYDIEIVKLDSINTEKDMQLVHSKELIESQSYEINRIKGRQKWLYLGLGSAVLLAILIAIFK